MPNTKTLDTDALHTEIMSFLRQDEMDYPGAAVRFGPAALPFLQSLITSNDEMLATRAAYLAGYMKDSGVTGLMTEAARSPFATVRIAAAHCASRLDAAGARTVLDSVVADGDPGVLKFAMRSIQAKGMVKAFQARIATISKDHHDAGIRGIAADVVRPGN